MNIVVAADPFAVELKDAIKEHLERKVMLFRMWAQPKTRNALLTQRLPPPP